MKFTINSKTFANALQQQLRVINAKNTLAILDNFKLILEDNLTIVASDPETTSTLTIEPAECNVPGVLCINAAKLTDIVRKFGEKPMTFERHEDEPTATITCGKGVYTFPVIDSSEYPVRDLPVNGYFKLPTQTLLDGFNATRNALSGDSIRPTLTGVYFNVLEEDKGIDFVGTDTHQLVCCHVEQSGLQAGGVIIPAKVVNLILTIFARFPEVEVLISERNISFRAENATLTSVLIQGTYPKYNRVLPTNAPFKVKVNRKELLDVINRVSGFASNATNLLILEDNGMMELKVSARDFDYSQEAEDYIMADGTMNGIKIGFSSEYLQRILSIFAEDEVTLQFTDPARPMLIEEGDIKAIIMPMQITQ